MTEATKELPEKLQKIVDEIKNLTALELADLVKALEDTFGVSAAAAMPVMAMPGAGAAGGGEAAAEEPTSFNVKLKEIGDKKLQVIKVVRTIVNLGLKEAKELVEKAPVVVKEKVDKEEAEKIRQQLEEVGAVVELVPA